MINLTVIVLLALCCITLGFAFGLFAGIQMLRRYEEQEAKARTVREVVTEATAALNAIERRTHAEISNNLHDLHRERPGLPYHNGQAIMLANGRLQVENRLAVFAVAKLKMVESFPETCISSL